MQRYGYLCEIEAIFVKSFLFSSFSSGALMGYSSFGEIMGGVGRVGGGWLGALKSCNPVPLKHLKAWITPKLEIWKCSNTISEDTNNTGQDY